MIMRLRVYKMDTSVLLQAELAEQEGLPALRIVDAYEGRSEQEMYLRKTDKHPTPAAHALIAEELYEKLLAEPRLGPLVRGNDQGYTR